MSESKEDPQVTKRVMSEARGRYTVFEDSKVYHFDFPASVSLAMNYDIVCYLKDEIFKVLEKQKEEESKEKHEKIIDLNTKK